MLKICPLAAVLFAASANAQSVVHYWDFSTMDDLVGGVTSVAVGTPDLSVHATYGEARPGSGPSLNTIVASVTNGGGFIRASVFSGPVTGMDFGTGSYSMSFWVWDDFAGDGDSRGPRVFDCLAGTTVGIQQAGDTTGSFIVRNDDDASGDAIITAPAGFPIQDQWAHISVTIDRTLDEIEFFVNGASQGIVPLIAGNTGQPLAGNIVPSQDLEIGVINGGDLVGEAQDQGLDDLAFYTGLLSQADITGLANGSLTPLDFLGTIGTGYCGPAVQNSANESASISASGSDVAADNNVLLTTDDMPANQFGYFLNSQTQAFVFPVPGSQGALCVGGAIGRYNASVFNTGSAGTGSLSLDLANTPTPSGTTAIAAGETWNFTTWYRDNNPGPTSNFSDAVSILFQ